MEGWGKNAENSNRITIKKIILNESYFSIKIILKKRFPQSVHVMQLYDWFSNDKCFLNF